MSRASGTPFTLKLPESMPKSVDLPDPRTRKQAAEYMPYSFCEDVSAPSWQAAKKECSTGDTPSQTCNIAGKIADAVMRLGDTGSSQRTNRGLVIEALNKSPKIGIRPLSADQRPQFYVTDVNGQIVPAPSQS